MRSLVVLIAVGCYGTPTVARWFEARGGAAPTWEPCTRVATAMRLACGADASCAAGVTARFSYYCYKGHYEHAPRGEAEPSPCFWDRGGATQPAWIDATCARFGLPSACRDELAAVIARCNEELTGAGP